MPAGANGSGSQEELELPNPLVFLPLLLLQGAGGGGGGMDLSRVGERILSSVRSAASLGLIPPPQPDRPQVPARAAAAAAVARAIAGLPPHQRHALPSNSEELVSIYGSRPHGQAVEELEEDFYEEDFDPVKYVLDNIPSEDTDASYFEEKAALRLAQLDKIAERLSRHVMEHHEEMVKGMQLVMELEQDLKVANVICRNGRRHISSSMHEVSRDLVVHSNSKKKQALLDMLPILTELRHAIDMQMELDTLVEEGNYFRAFQVLSEYLQVLDSYSELSALQEMGRGVEAWLARTLQKLDALLLGVCQMFKEESYVTAVDAYALVGDVAGLSEKIQSFFMQEVLSETHSVLKDIIEEEIGSNAQRHRLTYSDLCMLIPESKFRQCLLITLDTLFRLLCSYYAIMSFQPSEAGLPPVTDFAASGGSSGGEVTEKVGISFSNSSTSSVATSDAHTVTSSSGSPFLQLRKDATGFVSQALDKGRRNLWQLTTSRVSVLLSSSAVFSTSTFQFLRNYEDLNVFILAGEAFCGVEAIDFRQRLKNVSESYVAAFHRQNIYALKMVLERENWIKISAEAQVISFAGLIGDGAPLIVPSARDSSTLPSLHVNKISPVRTGKQKNGFSDWLKMDSPFSSKLTHGSNESPNAHMLVNGSMSSSLADANVVDSLHGDRINEKGQPGSHANGNNVVLEDENEDLLADFIDEDSQLPSRISKPIHARSRSSHWSDEEVSAQTGSSICLLRLMDKYARLIQKLEIVNIEIFKGICQLFGIFYHFVFETFGQRDTHQSSKFPPDSLPARLKAALSKVVQDCDQWVTPQHVANSSSPTSSVNTSFTHIDVMPTIPSSTIFRHAPIGALGLKERCAGAETITLVARVLLRSKAHLHSMLYQHNSAIVEDFYGNLVSTVPDLTEHIHKTTARMLLHINGYADKVANAKWEVKELGVEHNG
ncbi:syndetin [Iris pallida]|uniref:Syndetin n=1 Tax=Iris pallida TaxID=29817 RepID=A0AAX6I9D5_IRIPA|nr:syndetin [Iris pallida]